VEAPVLVDVLNENVDGISPSRRERTTARIDAHDAALCKEAKETQVAFIPTFARWGAQSHRETR
jgi:hypothetical protein